MKLLLFNVLPKYQSVALVVRKTGLRTKVDRLRAFRLHLPVMWRRKSDAESDITVKSRL